MAFVPCPFLLPSVKGRTDAPIHHKLDAEPDWYFSLFGHLIFYRRVGPDLLDFAFYFSSYVTWGFLMMLQDKCTVNAYIYAYIYIHWGGDPIIASPHQAETSQHPSPSGRSWASSVRYRAVLFSFLHLEPLFWLWYRQAEAISKLPALTWNTDCSGHSFHSF